MIHPPDRAESRPNTAKLARAEHKKPFFTRSDTVEFLSPPSRSGSYDGGSDRTRDIKHIIHRWKPFNRGEFAVDRLDNLYPRTLQMPVTVRAGGLGEYQHAYNFQNKHTSQCQYINTHINISSNKHVIPCN